MAIISIISIQTDAIAIAYFLCPGILIPVSYLKSSPIELIVGKAVLCNPSPARPERGCALVSRSHYSLLPIA
ncbi:MAG: hypothetical protein AAFO04_15970 [Cyanobacteria bacterium J06592_8]